MCGNYDNPLHRWGNRGTERPVTQPKLRSQQVTAGPQPGLLFCAASPGANPTRLWGFPPGSIGPGFSLSRSPSCLVLLHVRPSLQIVPCQVLLPWESSNPEQRLHPAFPTQRSVEQNRKEASWRSQQASGPLSWGGRPQTLGLAGVGGHLQRPCPSGVTQPMGLPSRAQMHWHSKK